MKKISIALLATLMLLMLIPVSAAERTLTLDRVVQINNNQLVLEFSEPIAVNLKGENYGPWCAIRLNDGSGQPVRINDDTSVYYGEYLQWAGSIQFTDSRHDRLHWTLSDLGHIGVNSITDISSFSGALADFSHLQVAFALEEVPYDAEAVYVDNAVCNITTADGEVYLRPTLPNGWEKCNLPITVNYGYRVDLSALESVEIAKTYDYDLVVNGSALDIEENVDEQSPEVQLVRSLRNDPLILAAIIGGSVVLSTLLIVIGVIIKKKKAVRS